MRSVSRLEEVLNSMTFIISNKGKTCNNGMLICYLMCLYHLLFFLKLAGVGLPWLLAVGVGW